MALPEPDRLDAAPLRNRVKEPPHTVLNRLALLIVPLLAAQATPAAAQTVAAADPSCTGSAAEEPAYRLQTGDLLTIDFRFTPEFNASMPIRPDGRITMSGLGDVAAAGRTVRELTCTLVEAYRPVLRDPVISVSVRPAENPSFIVSGEVERPGKYELKGGTTLTEAVAIAGGFKRSAKQSRVYLFRRQTPGGEFVSEVVDLKAMLDKGSRQRDVALREGDMLFIPQSGFSKFERFIPVPGLGVFLQPR